MPNRAEIEEKIKTKKDRLSSYYAREKEMLNGGVQSYGVGTRSEEHTSELQSH